MVWSSDAYKFVVYHKASQLQIVVNEPIYYWISYSVSILT